MTYRPLDDLEADDLDPGGEGEGRGSFNAADASLWWSGECESNSSEKWGVTWPVCSTRFSSLVVMVVVTVVLAVITLWTILGNVLVLCALYRYRVLRTMSNCLIGNLAVSDLLLAITVLPISTANDVLGYWVFGQTMCTLWLSVDVLYCTASIWGLCTIAFDRYTATVYPMWYHDKRSPRKALAYMVFVWLFSIVISLAPFIGWRDMISRFYIHDVSINRYMCILFSSQSYVIYSAMGSFILPLCLMTFLYVQIFVVLHRQAVQLKRRPRISRDLSSRVDTDCGTLVLQDGPHVLSRDFTASSFMGDNPALDRERGGRKEGGEEEEEEGEEEDKEVTMLPSRTRFQLEDREQTDQVSPSPDEACQDPLLDQRSDSRSPDEACQDPLLDQRSSSRSPDEACQDAALDHRSNSRSPDEACQDPLLDQRSNSRSPDETCQDAVLLNHHSNGVDTVLETSRRGDSPMLPFSPKGLLSVSARETPLQLHMRKSRSAAFHFEDKAGHEPRCFQIPLQTRIPRRSHSIATFAPDTDHSKGLENGHSGRPLFNLQRFPLTWTASSKEKSCSMNVSMRRRFQLREQRATKRMLLIMACFFVCWVPFTLMYMLRSLCPHCAHLDDHVTAFIIWLGYVNSSLNPLLYTLFNDDFRKAFKKLLGLYRPRRSSATE